MSGFYPDVPSHRVPYDRDGTIGFTYNETLGCITVPTSGNCGNVFYTAAQLRELNDEDTVYQNLTDTTSNGHVRFLTLFFPELLDLRGWYLNMDTLASFSNTGIFTSADTTNGVDGTWTQRQATWAGATSGVGVSPSYRTNINAVTWNSVRSIRWRFNSFSGGVGTRLWGAVHLYGFPTSFAAAPHLWAWHPTLDQEAGGAYFDWGDVAQSSVATKSFRIKNRSATLTANSVGVSLEVLSDASPTLTNQFEFSTDGVTFSPTINIGSLAPGAVSGVLHVRRTTPAGAALSTWSPRAVALPGSWS